MSTGELREIIAAQSKAIQDLTATLLAMTAKDSPNGPEDEPPTPPAMPMRVMTPELMSEQIEGLQEMSMPRVVKFRIPKDLIIGGVKEARRANMRRAAV